MEDLVEGLMEDVMMTRRTRMRLEVVVRTRGEIIPIISMIRSIEIKEEEAEAKNLEEEVSVGNVFTVENKGKENLSVPGAKEGKIRKQKANPKIHMLIKCQIITF